MVMKLVDLLAPKTTAYHEIWLDNSMVAGRAVQDFEPIYGPSYLPRKFKIVISVPPNIDVDVYAHDLGYIAIADPDTKQVTGYNVLIGGGMGQTHGDTKTYPRPASIIGYIPADDAVIDVTKAVVETQRDYGDRVNRKRARFKCTVDDPGLDFVKKEIEERSGVKLEEAGLRDDSIVVHMTGCPNGCTRPYLAELAFVGKAPGTYNMYLGGTSKGERLNKLYMENLQEEAILNEVNPMINLGRTENESFGDWVIRTGYVKKTSSP